MEEYMRLSLASLALLASLSPAYAEDRVWSGVFTGEGKVAVYKVTIPETPYMDTEAYLIAQGAGNETCYVSFSIALDTESQIALMGMPTTMGESFGGPTTYSTCENAGWVKGQNLTLLIKPVEKSMDVVIDGTIAHTVTVE